MKYLQDYIKDEQSRAFKEANVIFAFSEKQFLEQKEDGIIYTNLGNGMICNRDKVDWLLTELTTIVEKGIEQDIEENGIENIVKRELANREAYYTGDIESTVDALTMYPVDTEQILSIYKNEQSTRV